MLLRRTFEPPDLLVADLAGVITSRDQGALVDWVRDTLLFIREARVLVLLHSFGGWQIDSAFADPRLWLQDHDQVSKLAIVGDEEWRLGMLTFIVQPLRRTAVEYFETEAAAREWLGVSAATGHPIAF